MCFYFHFEVVLNQQLLLFKPVVHFRFVLVGQILKAFDSPINSLLALRVHDLQKVPLKQGLFFPLLD